MDESRGPATSRPTERRRKYRRHGTSGSSFRRGPSGGHPVKPHRTRPIDGHEGPGTGPVRSPKLDQRRAGRPVRATGRNGAPWQVRTRGDPGSGSIVSRRLVVAVHRGGLRGRVWVGHRHLEPAVRARPRARSLPRGRPTGSLILRGLAPDEAANLTAYLAGIGAGEIQLDPPPDQPAPLPPPDEPLRPVRRAGRNRLALTHRGRSPQNRIHPSW